MPESPFADPDVELDSEPDTEADSEAEPEAEVSSSPVDDLAGKPPIARFAARRRCRQDAPSGHDQCHVKSL